MRCARAALASEPRRKEFKKIPKYSTTNRVQRSYHTDADHMLRPNDAGPSRHAADVAPQVAEGGSRAPKEARERRRRRVFLQALAHPTPAAQVRDILLHCTYLRWPRPHLA